MLKDFSALLWGVLAVGAFVVGVWFVNEIKEFLKNMKDRDVEKTLDSLRNSADVLPTRFKKNEPAVNIATQDGTGVYTIRESELKNASRFQRDLLKRGVSVEVVEKLGFRDLSRALNPVLATRALYTKLRSKS